MMKNLNYYKNLFSFLKINKLTFFNRTLSSEKTDSELRLINKLKERLPIAKEVNVIDISHGCGDMYKVHVISSEFKGKSLVDQHRIIQNALKDDIKNWHGLTIDTESC